MASYMCMCVCVYVCSYGIRRVFAVCYDGSVDHNRSLLLHELLQKVTRLNRVTYNIHLSYNVSEMTHFVSDWT